MAPYYVTVDIGKDIHDKDVTHESGSKYYYYGGQGYAYLEKKETDYGYVEYTHYPYNTGYYTYKLGSIVHNGNRQDSLPGRSTLSGIDKIRVYYSLVDKSRSTPFLISAGLYYKSEGNDSWSRANVQGIENELDKLSYEKRGEVILRLNKSTAYGHVTVDNNDTEIPGYIKRTHKAPDKFTVTSVYKSSTKIEEIDSISKVTSVNVYLEALNTVPVLLEFLKAGSSYQYYSPTNAEENNWQSDGSNQLEGNSLKVKLYSLTYNFRNFLILDPITVTSIGDITVKKGVVKLGQYAKYEYFKSGHLSFTLSGLSYKSHKLNVILSDKTEVKKITTYFTKGGDKLLAIYIHFEEKHEWYIPPDLTINIDHTTWFDTFITNGSEVSEDEAGKILKNVEQYNKLDLVKLKASDSTLGDKLVTSFAVTFDLEYKPSGDLSKPTKYSSDITNNNLTVIPYSSTSLPKFVRVNHFVGNFIIQGVKLPNGDKMKVDGGFPVDLLSGFYVYYEETDNMYAKPLLIVLKVESSNDTLGHIVGRYFLSKNGDSTTWDMLKIAGTNVEDADLKVILTYIVQHRKLDAGRLDENIRNKLKDVTKNLPIDLTMAKIKINVGKYTSENREIPYTRYSGTPYNYVRHASLFPSFTVSKIKTPSGEISGSILPPKDHLLVGFNAYYKGSKTEDIPLLVGLKELSRDTYIYYVPSPLKKDTWERSPGIIDSDIKEKLQESLKIFENDQRAKPEKATSGRGSLDLDLLKQINYKDFNITFSDGENNGFYKCVHKPIKDGEFTPKSVKCGSKALAGFDDASSKYSEAVVYFKDVNYENAVLIEAVCVYNRERGSSKTVYYYSKDSNNTWKSYKLSTIVEFKEYTEDLGITNSVITHIEQHDDKIDLGSLGALTEKLVQFPVVGQDGAGGGDQHASATDPWSYVWKAAVAGAGSGALGFGGWKAWKSLSTRT